MKNKYTIYAFLTLLFSSFLSLSAQVGINTNVIDPSAALQLKASDTSNALGFNFPDVALVESTKSYPFTNPKEGLVVYNTTVFNKDEGGVMIQDLVPGHYYWNGTKWVIISTLKEQFIIKQTIDKNQLGYDPTGSYKDVVSNSAFTFTDANANTYQVNYTKERCVQWVEDDISKLPGYGYCALTVNTITVNGVTYPNGGYMAPFTGGTNGILGSTGLTWEEAYNLARALGGYLVTIPQRTEWDFIRENVLIKSNEVGTPAVDASDTGTPLDNNVWIGYNRILGKTPGGGNWATFKWITGEVWSTNWMASASVGATVQHNFSQDEPSTNKNTQTTGESCAMIWNKNFISVTSETPRPWNDGECLYRSSGGYGKTNQLIVKFLK